jgi:hypothetical protein
MQTGYGTGKKTRVTDRFVRYPYPSNQRSAYAQQYYSKIKRANVTDHKQAWNLEKEAKVITGAKVMDMTTTTRDKLKGTIDPDGKRNRRDPKAYIDEHAPIAGASSYKQSFPSW